MHPCTVPQISACPPDTPQHCGYFSNGLRCRHAEHLFLRHAVKPCGATQSCAACRREARLPALRPCALRSLLRLRTGPSLPWLGRSPGQQSTGLLSFSGSPCCAWKTGAEHPGSARSPGRSLRFALPAALGHRPKPSVAWAFAGTTVHRTVVFTRLIPAHPPEPWPISGSPMARPCGRENCHGHFSFIGLTPVGSVPASRGLQRSQK
jgi:hypothetical protein